MINALSYEPGGQRQRFEWREQQEQDRHIHLHLHLHLNLTLRARRGSSTSLNATRVTKIFAALIAATVMPFWLIIMSWITQDGTPGIPTILSRLAPLAGLALAWCVVGALLLATRRSMPYIRLGLLLLLLLLPIMAFVFLPIFWPLIMVVLMLHPLFTALLLLYVNREARALRLESPDSSRLSFMLVGGMWLAWLGGLLFDLHFLLWGMLPTVFPPVMGAAIIVGISALLGPRIYSLFASRKSRNARPKDASTSD